MIYGNWDNNCVPHRPTVNAVFGHSSTQKSVSLKFLIDSGADQTFIVPEHQKLLGIPEDYRMFQVKAVDTIAGEIPFNFLTDCFLIFTDHKGKPKMIPHITIYFAIKEEKKRFLGFKKNKKNPLTGTNAYPSILGRDVLSQLCMGYCNPSNYLFLSDRFDDYLKGLIKDFPEPPPPTSPTTKPIKWLGTNYEIGGLEIH